MSRGFESADFRRFSWSALLISSVAFRYTGTTGSPAQWLERRTPSPCAGAEESTDVVARATTRTLLAAWVLATGAWYLW
jgi:hypothetical protein